MVLSARTCVVYALNVLGTARLYGGTDIDLEHHQLDKTLAIDIDSHASMNGSSRPSFTNVVVCSQNAIVSLFKVLFRFPSNDR